jgi:hypothetical protein
MLSEKESPQENQFEIRTQDSPRGEQMSYASPSLVTPPSLKIFKEQIFFLLTFIFLEKGVESFICIKKF